MTDVVTGPELANAMLDTETAPPDDDLEPAATDFSTAEIVLYVTPVKGDGFIDDMGAPQSVLFAQQLTVNGIPITHPKRHPDLHYGDPDLEVRLVFSVQGFLELWIDNPPEDIVETLGLTAEDWLDGSKQSGPFGLPVRSFEIKSFPLRQIVSAT